MGKIKINLVDMLAYWPRVLVSRLVSSLLSRVELIRASVVGSSRGRGNSFSGSH